jgi:hypothetical protein
LHRRIIKRRRRRHISTAPYKQTKKHLPVPVVYSKSVKLDDLDCIELENNDCYMIRNSGPGFKQPQITKFSSDATVTEGAYTTIKVSGEPQPAVTWYNDGKLVGADYGREIGSLTIPPMELKHSQTEVYEDVATNTYHGSQERKKKLIANKERGVNEVVFSRPIPVPEFDFT